MSTFDVAPPISERYSEEHVLQNGRLYYANSPNLEVLNHQGHLAGLVIGYLSGPLRDVELSSQESTAARARSALQSNGTFALIVPGDDCVTVITDAAGSIPVYYAHGQGNWALGTLVHHVATASGRTTVDNVSAVDYLLNQAICYPYSWYEDVFLLPPASICRLDENGLTVDTYWQPSEPSDIYDRSADARVWGARLRDRVATAVQRGIEGQARSRLMYSGGIDSRAVLSLIPDAHECIPTIVLNKQNREYRLARRGAQLLGRSLEWVQRPKDFYRSAIYERIDRIGPGRDFRHTHIAGPVAARFEDADVVLGGYHADALFKTYDMSNVRERLGRPSVLQPPRPNVVKMTQFDTAEAAYFRADLVEAARDRRRAHHKRLKELRPLTAGNWHPLWPLSGQSYGYPHFLSCLRMNAHVIEPFMFQQTYLLAAEMPDPCRVDAEAFRYAFAKGMGLSGWTPTTGHVLPRLGPRVGSVYRLLHRALWKGVKTLRGTDDWEAGAWTREHEGWHPVTPKECVPEESLPFLLENLSVLIDGIRTDTFFEESSVRDSIRVRALGLGFRGVPETTPY